MATTPAGGSPSGCLRLFSIPARAARTGRRRLLHLAATAPFTHLVLAALDALAKLGAAPLADTG